VIIINFALGTAAEVHEFSFSQKCTTSAKIFSNATTVGKISHSWLSIGFEYFNAKFFKFYAGQNNCFFVAEMFPALHVYCSSVFLDSKSKCAAAFPLFLRLSST